MLRSLTEPDGVNATAVTAIDVTADAGAANAVTANGVTADAIAAAGVTASPGGEEGAMPANWGIPASWGVVEAID